MEFRSSRVQGVQGVARKPGCHSHVSRKCCQTHTPKNAIGGVGWSGLVHWIGAMDWWNHLHTERQIYKLEAKGGLRKLAKKWQRSKRHCFWS